VIYCGLVPFERIAKVRLSCVKWLLKKETFHLLNPSARLVDLSFSKQFFYSKLSDNLRALKLFSQGRIMKLKASTVLKTKLTFYFCLCAIFIYDIFNYLNSEVDGGISSISWFAPLLIVALSLDIFFSKKQTKH
jgi:hypothetical protein